MGRRREAPRTERMETILIRVINYCLQRAWFGKRDDDIRGIT